jgi:hypothetical protein
MRLIEIALIASLLATNIFVIVLALVLKIKNTKLISSVGQLIVDKKIISDELDRMSFVINNSSTIENDFIKFLSESRDGAYEYIEDVQSAILDLHNSMGQDDEDKIDVAYKNLLNFLPTTNDMGADK